jgi:hypothetical protein
MATKSNTKTKNNNAGFFWLIGCGGVLLFIFVILVLFSIVGLRWWNSGGDAMFIDPTSAPVVIAQPTAVSAAHCSLTVVGEPTVSAGSCKNCTVNYTKPGVVYVVGDDKAMSYTAGAWVYQYNQHGSEFENCINSQPFVSDPSYTIEWIK